MTSEKKSTRTTKHPKFKTVEKLIQRLTRDLSRFLEGFFHDGRALSERFMQTLHKAVEEEIAERAMEMVRASREERQVADRAIELVRGRRKARVAAKPAQTPKAKKPRTLP